MQPWLYNSIHFISMYIITLHFILFAVEMTKNVAKLQQLRNPIQNIPRLMSSNLNTSLAPIPPLRPQRVPQRSQRTALLLPEATTIPMLRRLQRTGRIISARETPRDERQIPMIKRRRSIGSESGGTILRKVLQWNPLNREAAFCPVYVVLPTNR